MDIQAEKIELVKMLLNTENPKLIKAVKSLLISFESDDWGDLPVEVVEDVKVSLREIEAGKGISDKDASETYKKWL